MQSIGSFFYLYLNFVCGKNKMFDNTYTFFQCSNYLKMAKRFETYSRADIRTIFLNDERGKLMKSDTLYENLYDYLTCFHATNSIILFTWYHPKMAKLEMNIRRKWASTKDLSFVNIVFEKIREKDEYLNRKKYLGDDEEKYFEILH